MSASATPPLTATTDEQPDDARPVKDRKIAKDQDAEDLRAVMGIAGGRRFMRRILGQCGTFRSPFAGESTHITAFNDGKADVGRWLYAQLEAISPEEFIAMLREAQRVKKAR